MGATIQKCRKGCGQSGSSEGQEITELLQMEPRKAGEAKHSAGWTAALLGCRKWLKCQTSTVEGALTGQEDIVGKGAVTGYQSASEEGMRGVGKLWLTRGRDCGVCDKFRCVYQTKERIKEVPEHGHV